MLRFQNHLRIFLFQNAKILRIPIKSLFLESYEIPILRISYKKGSLLKVRRVTDESQTTTDNYRRVTYESQTAKTSHRRATDDYRRVRDEPQTTTDESQTSHGRLRGIIQKVF